MMKLVLIGSDGVVLALNKLNQQAFLANEEPAPKKIVLLLGDLLLAIRKSMGNETTKIDNIGMIEWCINDARSFISGP